MRTITGNLSVRLLALGALGFVFTGCSDPVPQLDCTQDTECGSNYICVQSACEPGFRELPDDDSTGGDTTTGGGDNTTGGDSDPGDVDGGDTGGRDIDAKAKNFNYDQLSDIVPFNGPFLFLATNVPQKSLDVIDMYEQSMVARINLAGSPERVFYDAPNNRALVVHGVDSVTRLDVVDLTDTENMTTQQVDLSANSLLYQGTDVTVSETGEIYVLGKQDSFDFAPLRVDLEGATVTALQLVGGAFFLDDSGERILAADGALIINKTRYTFPVDGCIQEDFDGTCTQACPTDGCIEEDTTYDSDWRLPNKLQMHPGLEFLLYPLGEAVLEYAATRQDDIQNSFNLLSGNAYGVHDTAYTHAGDRVVALNLDYDTFFLQVYDRTTSVQQLEREVGPPDGTISYSREFMTISSDDNHCYVLAFDAGVNLSKTIIMRSRITFPE